ncbi:MAG: hypothetical protein WA971_10210, partial [Microbacterium sp.]
QTATLPLGADGTVTRRIRFLTTGFYALTLSACDDGYTGPGVDEGRWVSSGPFDPWDDVPFFVLEDAAEQVPTSEPTPTPDPTPASTPELASIPDPTPTS